jgi:SEFIR domain
VSKGSIDQPKVFISYSWTSSTHEQWVLELAQRLSGDGIVVILDKWDLREGQDKHAFMEQMVKDVSINKVLVICDRVYQEKADSRSGGVGTETQLISKKVYENTGQEKFIPIVREYDGMLVLGREVEAASVCQTDTLFNYNYYDFSWLISGDRNRTATLQRGCRRRRDAQLTCVLRQR